MDYVVGHRPEIGHFLAILVIFLEVDTPAEELSLKFELTTPHLEHQIYKKQEILCYVSHSAWFVNTTPSKFHTKKRANEQ